MQTVKLGISSGLILHAAHEAAMAVLSLNFILGAFGFPVFLFIIIIISIACDLSALLRDFPCWVSVLRTRISFNTHTHTHTHTSTRTHEDTHAH